MVKLIPAIERHNTSADWLQSYFLFSFADYYDPHNMHFGPLRVFNDDTIAPHAGFPQHPHSEMEIITIVLEGQNPVDLGSTVGVHIDPARLHLFNAEGNVV